MKTVVQQTGITPTTLRAWERRYGILQPDRTDGGYRLYSEHDIALLRWLKSQVDSGVNIGRAVALLSLRRQEAEAQPTGPASSATRFKASPEPVVAPMHTDTRHTDAIAEELLQALHAFCETRASTILSEAFALYPVEVVTENIIVPALTTSGERCLQGATSVVQANFVASFLRQKISSMFTAYSQPPSGPLAVTGSAPGEWHDIGILLVSLALRRQGWRVLYLGQNVPASQLIRDLPELKPELVCISASTTESAMRLLAAADAVAGLPDRPRFLFGGRAFDLNPDLRTRFAEAYAGPSASQAVAALAQPA
jgi:DNA-binding transcriptional MerR regulator